MRDNDVIPVSVRVPESIVEVGVCPFCGQGYEFQTIGQATDELLEKWAVQKCGCIDARLERMAEEERRKEERRRR
ncbi:MAG: hypothetical protein Q4F24_07935 [Eubacteriales bacterium]|nr:hypothetical protein [Eubacteriales bacterium]